MRTLYHYKCYAEVFGDICKIMTWNITKNIETKEREKYVIFTKNNDIIDTACGAISEFQCTLNYSDLIEYLKLAESEGIEDIHAIIGSLRYSGDFSMENGYHTDESYQP